MSAALKRPFGRHVCGNKPAWGTCWTRLYGNSRISRYGTGYVAAGDLQISAWSTMLYCWCSTALHYLAHSEYSTPKYITPRIKIFSVHSCCTTFTPLERCSALLMSTYTERTHSSCQRTLKATWALHLAQTMLQQGQKHTNVFCYIQCFSECGDVP